MAEADKIRAAKEEEAAAAAVVAEAHSTSTDTTESDGDGLRKRFRAFFYGAHVRAIDMLFSVHQSRTQGISSDM